MVQNNYINGHFREYNIKWRISSKRGIYCTILGRFLLFARSSLFLADWLVLKWKASLGNCFCWFALRFQEITYAKKLGFPSGIFWRSFVEWKTKETLFCCSTNKLLKTWPGETKFFAYILTWEQSKNQRQKYRTTFFYYIEDHMQKFS